MNGLNDRAICPICKVNGTAVPHWPSPRFTRCKECGAIFREPFPSEAQLSALYTSSWADRDSHIDETGGTSRELGRRMLTALLRELGIPDFAGRRILDFGAGRGGVSSALRDLGAEVVAVEPFGYAQLQRLGIPVCRELGELAAEPQFDGIVMMEVVEHLRDPRELLRRLHSLLKPGGWIFLTTPNPLGFSAKVRGRRWGSAANLGHILFFSGRTLRRVLAELEFATVRRTWWVIRFPDSSPAHSAVQSLLQLIRLDGGLRFLAVKR